RAEVVGRRHHEENFRAFAVDRNFDGDAGDFARFVGGEVDTVLETVRLDAQVIARPKTVGGGFEHPVDVAADQIQQLAVHHGDFRRVDAVGTEHRAAAAFGAMVEVVEPFLDNVFGQFAAAGERAKDASAN